MIINLAHSDKRFLKITEENYDKIVGTGLGDFNENQIGMYLVKQGDYWYLATEENWLKSKARYEARKTIQSQINSLQNQLQEI